MTEQYSSMWILSEAHLALSKSRSSLRFLEWNHNFLEPAW